jgi:hypothetical protein
MIMTRVKRESDSINARPSIEQEQDAGARSRIAGQTLR